MIGIVDYGMGNLGSVRNACAYLRLPVRLVTRSSEIEGCRALIVPGVGAFGDCAEELRRRGFADPLKSWITQSRPLLGICVGLQILFECSEESPGIAGLGILPGKVRRFVPVRGHKIPQMGWNRVRIAQPECPLFHGIPDGSFFYFVHSFFVEVEQSARPIVAGETEYGVCYASAVLRERLAAVQFHPEKSHAVGLRMIANFARWAGIQEVE